MPASEDRAISDFPIASSLTNRALALLSAPDGQGGYDSVHAEINEIGRTILETDYTQDLDTTDKSVFGAINENKSVIGYSYDEYDATTAYSKDDLCIYNNTLYKALQATTGNLPTNTTYWEQTSIADEINELDSGKQDKLNPVSKVITPATGTTIDGVSFYKYGNVVNLTMRFEVANPTSWSNIATFPSDCAPSVETFGVAVNTSSTTGVQTAHIGVYSNGTIKLANTLPDSGKKYGCSLTWIQE